MTLEFKKMDDDPNVEQFCFDNGTIQDMVKDSYFAVVRHQGEAYIVLRDGAVVGYCMIKVGAVEYEDPDAFDERDSQYGAIFIRYIVVNKPDRRHGIGGTMLDFLISRARIFSRQLPIRLLVVEALNEYCDWYQKFGFRFVTEKNEVDPTSRMVIDFVDREQLETYISEHSA